MAATTQGSADLFKQRFLADRPAEAGLADRVIAWATAKHLLRKWSSAGTVDSLTCRAVVGQYEHKILTLETNGLVWVLFGQLLSGFPNPDPKAREKFHQQLCARLGKIPGGNSPSADYKSKASWRLGDMDLPAFLAVADWLLVELQKTHETTVALHAANRARH